MVCLIEVCFRITANYSIFDVFTGIVAHKSVKNNLREAVMNETRSNILKAELKFCNNSFLESNVSLQVRWHTFITDKSSTGRELNISLFAN